MSFEEYDDLYLLAQNNSNAKYHMFSYDICGSREMKDLKTAEVLMRKLAYNMIKDILLIEKSLNRKILVQEKGYVTIINNFQTVYSLKGFARKEQPLFLGDAFAITIYNGSLSEEQVNNIFENNKQKLNINYNFHKANCLYETDSYEEGNTKYFRSYAFQKLTTMHKK